jgi:lipopolysaccharide heptosyltransferase II
MSAGPPAGAPRRVWGEVRRVLAVRLDNLGDVLMTTPALAAIRQNAPQASLSLLASPAGAALDGMLPDVDDTIVFEAPWVKAGVDAASRGELGASERRLVDDLAARRFDAAVIFTVCTQSALPAALCCRLAGIPLRLAHSRENPYALLSDWVADREQVATGMRHEVQRQLALLAAVGWGVDDDRLRIGIAADARVRVAARLAAHRVAPEKGYFVVHPGASAPARRYAAAGYAAAAEAIARHSGCTPVFTGAADERALVEELRGRMAAPGVSLAGELSIAELAALIVGARVLVCNNTGPAHLAAAVGTPVVVLYAQTNPQHTPWRVRSRVLYHDVDCRHCLRSICPQGHHDCLAKVDPADIVDAALALMAPAGVEVA